MKIPMNPVLTDKILRNRYRLMRGALFKNLKFLEKVIDIQDQLIQNLKSTVEIANEELKRRMEVG